MALLYIDKDTKHHTFLMLVSSMSAYVMPGVRVTGVGVGGAAVTPSRSFETILPSAPLPWTDCGVGGNLSFFRTSDN